MELDAGARWPAAAAAALGEGEAVELAIRPEALAIAADGNPAALTGRVIERRYAGPTTYYRVELPGGAVVEVLVAERDLAGGSAGRRQSSLAPAPTAAVRRGGPAAGIGDSVGIVPSPQAGPVPRAFPTGAR